MNQIHLPSELEKLIKNQSYTVNNIGLSGSKVLMFEDRVLKINPSIEELRAEAKLLEWLQGQIPAPKLLFFCEEENHGYMLSSRVKGEMACSEKLMASPKKLISSLAGVIQKLWTVDISSCPVSATLDKKLASARKTVESGLADTENAEPETYGKGGFATPRALLNWLENNRPEEDLVFSHGDFCLPNVLFNENGLAGLIDIGRGGICDRWNDIAICHRSLIHNYVGKYASKHYDGFDPELILKELGIPVDREKLRYYKLLDELA